MGFPTIPTRAAGRLLSGWQADNSATRTFPNLSSLTKNSGDLLIAIVVGYQSSLTSAIFSSWGAGFTEIRDIGVSTHMCVGVAYKFSDGTESGTFTVTQGGTVTGHAAFFLLSIPGAHPSAAPEVSAALANGTTAAADPASLSPSWGADDTLWVAVAGSGETGTGGAYAGVSAAPANYSDYDDTAMSADAVGAVEAGIAFRQNAVASEDVGTFSVDVSNARNVAFVIAVRPGATAHDKTTTDSKTFSESMARIFQGLRTTADSKAFSESAAAVVTPPYIVYDTFTDATSTSLENHTPDVRPGTNAWHGFTSGDAYIDANDRAVASGEYVGAYIDADESDGVLSVTLGGFSQTVDTRMGLHFRGTDVDEWADHWTAFVYRSADGGYCVVGLEHSVAGSGTEDWVTELGSGAISAAGPHELRVEFDGTSIEVFWNDVSQHAPTTSSIHQTETNHGLSWANGGAGWYDDFTFLPTTGPAPVLGVATDSKTYSEAITRPSSFARSITQSKTFAEVMTRASGFLRSSTDSKAFSEVVTAIKSFARTATDSKTYSEVASRALGATRAATDARTYSEAITRASTFLRAATDARTASEVITSVRAYARAATDSKTFAEVVVGLRAIVKTATDSKTYSEAMTRVYAGVRTSADSKTFAEVASKVQGFVRAIADSKTYAEVASRAGTFVRAVTDARTTANFVIGEVTGQLIRFVSDAKTYAESVTRQGAFVRAVTQGKTFSEVVVGVRAVIRAATDSKTYAEVITRASTFVRSSTDSRAYAELVERLQAVVRTATDARTYAEVATYLKLMVRSAVDSRVFSETVTRTAAMVRSTTDVRTFLESVVKSLLGRLRGSTAPRSGGTINPRDRGPTDSR